MDIADKGFLESLHRFIVNAKAACYVGGGQPVPSCRADSHDLAYAEGDWNYLDSYFGGRDFIGEEVVFFKARSIWAMNYYGYILLPDLITPSQAGHMIKASLSRMYLENRFLGGFTFTEGDLVYQDASAGDLCHFTGRETITCAGQLAYELTYHGGLIKPG